MEILDRFTVNTLNLARWLGRFIMVWVTPFCRFRKTNNVPKDILFLSTRNPPHRKSRRRGSLDSTPDKEL
jgi:hypothetical protein